MANKIKEEKDWIAILWLVFFLYSVISRVFKFINTGSFFLTSIMLIIAFLGMRSIKKSRIECTIFKPFIYVYIYNIALFVIGLMYIPDVLYIKFYLSLFTNILLFSIFFYTCSQKSKAIILIQKLFKYVLPVYLFGIIVQYLSGMTFLNPFNLTLFPALYLFIPPNDKRILILMLLLSFFSIVVYADFRALVFLHLVGLFTLLLRFKSYVSLTIIKKMTYILLFLPLFLTLISVFSGWNPFTILDGSAFSSFVIGSQKIQMAGDSRSQFFGEIYDHLDKYNALLWGTTPGIGYQTSLRNVDNEFYEFLRNGRLTTEIGILEFFHYGGFANVCIVFTVFGLCIRNIFKYAKSRWAYTAAFYISFRWLFLFMEGDIAMTAQWFGLFLIMGLFCNKKILIMTDRKIQESISNSIKITN